MTQTAVTTREQYAARRAFEREILLGTAIEADNLIVLDRRLRELCGGYTDEYRAAKRAAFAGDADHGEIVRRCRAAIAKLEQAAEAADKLDVLDFEDEGESVDEYTTPDGVFAR